MKQFQGVWLPDHELHMLEWMGKSGEMVDGKGSYQIKKLRKALTYCRLFRTAVDIGGHCGTWSMQLAKRFDTVHAFEPTPAHQECFRANLADASNVILHTYALGEELKRVRLYSTQGSSGNTYVDDKGDIDAEMMRLDNFAMDDVDFIKLDCEGFELRALRGGEQTIRRCRPTICVEQKPGKAQKFGLGETDAVSYLQTLGYRVAEVLAGDFIMVPENDLREAA